MVRGDLRSASERTGFPTPVPTEAGPMRAWKRVHSLRARRLMKLLRRSYAFGRASQLVDEIASDVLPPQGVAIVLTERSGSRCPFWLARPPSERFCSDRGRTSGHCTSKGELGIEAWLCWRRPPCLRSVTFIPNSAFSVPPHPFVAGYEWRWRVLSSRGSAQL